MIYSNLIVTVSKGQSTINDRIILYRGDRKVEVIFEILQSAFKFSKGDNLITSTKASYGQLIIDKPDETFIFSDMTKCEDGHVKFTITGDMIDELTEVGLYAIQIRLFDESRDSRITIPPVEEAIEIREPMAEEDLSSISEVGESMVGEARVEEGVAIDDVFDEDGSYNPTTWYNGDMITESKLNKIENALYTINDKIENADGIDTDAFVTESELAAKGYLTEHQSLEGYATEEYVDDAVKNAEVDLKGYATEEYVDEAIKDAEVDLEGYATEEYVDDAVKNAEVDLKGYATEEYVDKAIEEADIDLSAYATIEYVDEALDGIEVNIGDNLEVEQANVSNILTVGDMREPVKTATIVQGSGNFGSAVSIGSMSAGNGSIDLRSGNGYFSGTVSQDGQPINDYDLTTKRYVDEALANSAAGTGTFNGPISVYGNADIYGDLYLNGNGVIYNASDIYSANASFINASIDASMTIGNGTSNPITLGNGDGHFSGVLSQNGVPTDDKHLTTKAYVDDAISNVEVDLDGYATTAYVDEAVGNIDIPDVDLDGYATTAYVDEAISNIEIDPDVDLSAYATTAYVDEAVGNIDIPEVKLDGYATEEYVNNAVSNVEVDLDGYATEEYVNNAINGIDLSGYASTEYVDEAVGNIDIPEVDLDGYATEEYVNNAVNGIDLSGYASTEYVDEAVGNIDIPEVDLDGYATEEYVNNAVNGIDLSDYAPIDSPNFTSWISMGRKKDSDIGALTTALGTSVTASGNYSHAEGAWTTASGEKSHAEGYSTKAEGENSHAEGSGSEAKGVSSHAEGYNTKAEGGYSHAEGSGSEAKNESSHAEGFYTIASSAAQHVQGMFNIEDANDIYAHIVGNGDMLERSNAHTLDWEGNAWFAGNVRVEGAPEKENDLVTKAYVDKAIATGGGSSNNTPSHFLYDSETYEGEEHITIDFDTDFRTIEFDINEGKMLVLPAFRTEDGVEDDERKNTFQKTCLYLRVSSYNIKMRTEEYDAHLIAYKDNENSYTMLQNYNEDGYEIDLGGDGIYKMEITYNPFVHGDVPLYFVETHRIGDKQY